MNSREENKRKLDELLGIATEMAKDGGVDEYIDGIGKNNPIPMDLPGQEIDLNTVFNEQGELTQSPHDVLDTLDKELESKEKEVSNAIEKIGENGIQSVEITMSEVNSLVDIAKRLIQHVYAVVTSADILDSSTLTAAASLIRETKGLLEKHLQYQREHESFLGKMKLEELKHQHQMELMERKYELERMKYSKQNPAIDTIGSGGVVQDGGSNGGMKSYSSSDLMRMLDKKE